MELTVERFALLWEAPPDCDRADVQRLVDAVDLILSQVEEIDTIAVNLDGVPPEHYETVLWVVEQIAVKFRLQPRKFFRDGERIYVNKLTTGQADLHEPPMPAVGGL